MRKSKKFRVISSMILALFVLASCPTEAVYAQTSTTFSATHSNTNEIINSTVLNSVTPEGVYEGMFTGRMVEVTRFQRHRELIDIYRFTKKSDQEQFQIFERLPQGGLGRILWIHEWVEGSWIDQEYFYEKSQTTGFEVMTILDYAAGTYISMELASAPTSVPLDLNHLQNWLNDQSYFRAIFVKVKGDMRREHILQQLVDTQSVILHSFDLEQIYDVLHLGRGPPAHRASTKETPAFSHEEVLS